MRVHGVAPGGTRVRAAAGTAATAVVLMAAVGCGGPGATGPARPTDGSGPVRDLTTAEEAVLDRAEGLLVRQCMAEAGFSFWPAAEDGTAEREGFGYVLDDVGWARKYGYGGQFAKKAEKARRSGPNVSYLNSLPRNRRMRYDATLGGRLAEDALTVELPQGGTVRTPRDGCRAAAQGELYGDFATWFRVQAIATNLTPLFVPDLVRDKRFREAVGAWSACMRTKGHDYPDPPAVRAELPALTEGLDDAEAHAVEVRLAVDEATCATTTRLAATGRALEREYRAEKTVRYREDVRTYQRLRLSALARAHEIVHDATA
ncbi:hypothetical protein ACIQFU_26245 [Streptomyces sp. NPDC093065]|uniref:hypothetical protein n=1 Tax=Streptomyces sp. NPDC093065 TaxID=3366021 RepID=UPI0037FDEAED